MLGPSMLMQLRVIVESHTVVILHRLICFHSPNKSGYCRYCLDIVLIFTFSIKTINTIMEELDIG